MTLRAVLAWKDNERTHRKEIPVPPRLAEKSPPAAPLLRARIGWHCSGKRIDAELGLSRALVELLTPPPSNRGDKGDKGDAGESIKGDKGDKGDPGKSIKGEKGDKGDAGESIKGDRGARGVRGEKGNPGRGISSIEQPRPGWMLIRLTDGAEELIRLPAGEDGREIELGVEGMTLRWRYKGTRDWHKLLDLASLIRPAGGGQVKMRFTQLVDVDTTGLADGQVFAWNAAAGKLLPVNIYTKDEIDAKLEGLVSFGDPSP